MTTVRYQLLPPPAFVYEAAVSTYRRDFELICNRKENKVINPGSFQAPIDLTFLLRARYYSQEDIRKNIELLHSFWEQYFVCYNHPGLTENIFVYDESEDISYEVLTFLYPELEYAIVRRKNSCLLVFFKLSRFTQCYSKSVPVLKVIKHNVIKLRHIHDAEAIIIERREAAWLFKFSLYSFLGFSSFLAIISYMYL